MEDPWTKQPDEVVNYFKSDENSGLDDNQVKRYQEKYGPNGECILYNYITYEFKDMVEKSG